MLAGAGRPRVQPILFFALLLLAFQFLLPAGVSQTAPGRAHSGHASAAAEPVDPHKDSSETNHHIAGYGLIAMGLLVLAARIPRFSVLSLVWPALFIVLGLFLVVWSDPEIWPRGELGLSWLLTHGRGARQHKIWALLLIVLGSIEYLRARKKMGRFWQAWAFPLLALFGAALLLVHQHAAPIAVKAEPPPPPPHHMHGDMQMPADQGASPAPASSAPASAAPASSAPASSSDHDHAMSATAERIDRQHLWFAVVGAAVALFKFLSDGGFWRRRFVPYLWPGCVAVLGVLLVLYRE